jgi:hypothetical protein
LGLKDIRVCTPSVKTKESHGLYLIDTTIASSGLAAAWIERLTSMGRGRVVRTLDEVNLYVALRGNSLSSRRFCPVNFPPPPLTFSSTSIPLSRHGVEILTSLGCHTVAHALLSQEIRVRRMTAVSSADLSYQRSACEWSHNKSTPCHTAKVRR